MSSSSSLSESDNIGNSLAIFGPSFLILFLILLFVTKIDEFWSGILAWSCSLSIACGYFLITKLKSGIPRA
jgi:hypothetical protein